MKRHGVRLLAGLVAVAAPLTCAEACSSDDAPNAPDTDASAPGDAASGADASSASDAGATTDGAAVDASCPKTKTTPATGQTCVGFGAASPCGGPCGLPAYGYVCANGGPPGFTGCVQASSTGGFGDTYCCPKNDCVAQPDQDTMCSAAGQPHRFQCPPAANGQPVAPPAGCTDGGSTGALETFYCCP